MLVVRDLLSISSLSLSVAAGSRGLDSRIRFAHTSELADPTPWLTGGELLLTTGMGVGASPASQRAYVERLARAGLAGLGLGLGFAFDETPPALRAAADERAWPVLEVPFKVPFIAITEVIAARLTAERVREAQMSVEVHDRFSAMVAGGGGPADVLDELAALAAGWALLFGLGGDVVARAAARGVAVPESRAVWDRLPRGLLQRSGPATAADTTPSGTRLAVAVHVAGRPEAVLVVGKDRRLEQRDRIVTRHAVTVLGLLLSARRAVVEAERRIAGDILSEAFSGRVAGGDLERRLELVGFPPDSSPTVLIVETRDEPDELGDVVWVVDSALGARCPAVRTAQIGRGVAAVVLHEDPPALARALADELGRALGGPAATAFRVGLGTTVPPGSLRDSFLAALFALRAAPPGQDVVLPADLGSYRFLLGAQTRPALEGYVRSVLGPLIDRDEARSSDLVESVRAFIWCGGRWERAADLLGVHRHTLRYRLRQVEDLLGRDLASTEDRMEVWLALKALDVLNA